MPTRKEIAKETFNSGCNCAQAVLTSFDTLLKKDKNELLAVSAGFGGGMGNLQNTCGAVTGAYMMFSLYASMQSNDNSEAKNLSGGMIREFDKKFRSKKGTTSCREILGIDINTEAGQKEAKEKNVFETVCLDAVETAVEIAEDILAGKK